MLKQFRAMYTLLFNYWRKSFHNVFFAFVFPIMSLLILSAIPKFLIKDLVPGMIASAAPVVGIVSLAMSFSDLKETIIYKRISLLPLKTWIFVASIISFYTILIWISALWIFIFSLIWYKQLPLASINFGYLILGMIFLSIICSSIGVIVATIAKDYKTANAISMLFYLPPAWISGMYLPINIILQSKVLKTISMTMPFSYPVTLINYGWDKNALLLFNEPIWVFVLISLGISILFISLAIISFKFRKKK
ncbi:ABC transporter permease [Metamycoplasma auris]|uniref:Transport permease protein n=1 Tax=Metamycoplasma auris TaxID=51363 RepID=A0A2W7G071_9BACT|nr:ABC transporter permease [Metamycoplasma auris]PZV99951.1 ABC-2 type transport system permease protein [Metamycoplasma auris]